MLGRTPAICAANQSHQRLQLALTLALGLGYHRAGETLANNLKNQH